MPDTLQNNKNKKNQKEITNNNEYAFINFIKNNNVNIVIL